MGQIPGAQNGDIVEHNIYMDTNKSVYNRNGTAGITFAAATMSLSGLGAVVGTGTMDLTGTFTGTDEMVNVDVTMSHATQTAIGVDVSIAQITNARTSGELVGVRSSITSLNGTATGVDHVAFAGICTAGDADSDHILLRQGANFTRTIDSSAAATGETFWLLGGNLASAWKLGTSALTYAVLRSTTAAPGIDETFALSGTGDAHNIAATMSHATQVAEGLDVSIAQITNARTSGTISAIKASVTSLTGSTAGVDHYAFEAACTVGEAGADHFVMKQGAGFDNTFDLTACATTEAGLLVSTALADAWHWKSASLTYLVLRTTAATPGIDETFTVTATGSVHTLTTTVNSATGVVSGLDSAITTATTNHTSGTIAAYKARITSLAGDTGGDFTAMHIVSTDGGGATPFHSGIYCDDPLDALVKVAADGDGGFVVGATMTRSPETDTESGYFRVNIGATVYQVPIYAA